MSEPPFCTKEIRNGIVTREPELLEEANKQDEAFSTFENHFDEIEKAKKAACECPHCASPNLKAGDFECPGDYSVFREVTCGKCGKTWEENFSITSITSRDITEDSPWHSERHTRRFTHILTPRRTAI